MTSPGTFFLKQVALKNKVTMKDCLDYIRDARARGLTAPVVLMGYLNPFLAYGLDNLMKEAQEAGKFLDRFVFVGLDRASRWS